MEVLGAMDDSFIAQWRNEAAGWRERLDNDVAAARRLRTSLDALGVVVPPPATPHPRDSMLRGRLHIPAFYIPEASAPHLLRLLFVSKKKHGKDGRTLRIALDTRDTSSGITGAAGQKCLPLSGYTGPYLFDKAKLVDWHIYDTHKNKDHVVLVCRTCMKWIRQHIASELRIGRLLVTGVTPDYDGVTPIIVVGCLDERMREKVREPRTNVQDGIMTEEEMEQKLVDFQDTLENGAYYGRT